MKAIILAAGYAKRLYPLTENHPKPLLDVAGKPLIEHLFEKLSNIRCLDQIYIITNAKFTSNFQQWADNYRMIKPNLPLKVINNGDIDNSSNLGAIGNLHLVLTLNDIDDDIIVVAGDNLISEDLHGFCDYSQQKGTPVLAVYDIGRLEEVNKYSAAVVNNSGRLIYFEEKPMNPNSTMIGIALYYYPKSTLTLIRQYVNEKNNLEQPGRLVEWMYRLIPFYTWRITGAWFDIGSREKLESANRILTKGNESLEL